MNAHPDTQEDDFVRQVREAVEAAGLQFTTMEFARTPRAVTRSRSDPDTWDLTIRATTALKHPYDESAMRAALAAAHVQLVRAFVECRTPVATELLISGVWQESATARR